MKKDLLFTLLTWTLLASLVYLSLLYMVFYNWMDPDTGLFRDDRMILLPVVPGLLMLLTAGILYAFPISQHRADAFRNDLAPTKGIWLLLVLSAGTLLCCFTLDLLYCQLVDASIPQTYAETVAQMSANAGRIPDDSVVNSFAQLPFFAQNIFMNSVTIILGNLLALMIGRSIAKPLVARLT